MKKYLFFVTMPIFVYLMTLHIGLDYFFAERAGVMWALSGLAAIAVARLYGPFVGLLTGYVLCSLVHAVFWIDNQFIEDLFFDGKIYRFQAVRPVIHRACLLGAFSTLMSVAAVWLKPISRELMAKLFTAFGLCICLHFWFLRPWWQPEGFLMTPTLAGVYLVLCLPAVKDGRIFAFFALTVLATGGRGCSLALAAYLTGCLWVLRPGALKYWIPACLATSGVVWAWKGTYWLTHDHGRSKVWDTALNWWALWDHRWFGLGSGTWYAVVPEIQKITNTLDHGQFGSTYAHNEYIQILFELGYVGLALFLVFWLMAVVRSKCGGDFKRVGFLFALAASSVSMFPLRSDAILFLVLFNLYDVLENHFKRPYPRGYGEKTLAPAPGALSSIPSRG